MTAAEGGETALETRMPVTAKATGSCRAFDTPADIQLASGRSLAVDEVQSLAVDARGRYLDQLRSGARPRVCADLRTPSFRSPSCQQRGGESGVPLQWTRMWRKVGAKVSGSPRRFSGAAGRENGGSGQLDVGWQPLARAEMRGRLGGCACTE